jgi:hypothetical protein
LCEKYDLSESVLRRALKEHNIPNRINWSVTTRALARRAEDEFPLEAHCIFKKMKR